MAHRPLVAVPLALMVVGALTLPAVAKVKAGERELELWTFYHASNHFLRTQLGLSFGLTDHLSVVFFGVVTNLHTRARKFRGLKLQGRYRFSENFELPLDLTVYLEYEPSLAAGEAGEIGGRLMAEKVLGRSTLTSLLMAEKDLDTARPLEVSATLGVTYSLSKTLQLGVESRYMRIGAGDRFYVGPAASLFLGSTRLSGGVYYGGNRETQGRLIIGQKF